MPYRGGLCHIGGSMPYRGSGYLYIAILRLLLLGW